MRKAIHPIDAIRTVERAWYDSGFKRGKESGVAQGKRLERAAALRWLFKNRIVTENTKDILIDHFKEKTK